MDIRYRLSQFWHNVTAKPLSGLEQEQITNDLTPQELDLFKQMSINDQRHGYRVYRLLRDSGHTDCDLLAAALLHDVGKVKVDLSVWDRTLAVLGETFFPQKAKEWGVGTNGGWKRTFVVREQHAAWGGDLAEQAGSRKDVIDLILRHQEPVLLNGSGRDDRLALLQWADDQN
ncbi:MAG: HD domain-containing protein [Candidatus Promineifilaceae bacterium]|jgi:predicted HD phosphohydrolase